MRAPFLETQRMLKSEAITLHNRPGFLYIRYTRKNCVKL